MTSQLKVYVTNEIKDIYERRYSDYEAIENPDEQRNIDNIKLEVLKNVDNICKQRGRY